MTERSHMDEFWRSLQDDDDGILVTTTDAGCLPEDEPTPSSKKLKKILKKKTKRAADPVVAEAIEEPTLAPDPIIEAEEIPHEPTPTRCDTPTQACAEPEPVVEEPACDDGQHTQLSDDNATTKDEAEGQENPVYLPFSAQHRLMVFLQHKLEEMCFSFSQRKLPQLLQDRAWDCPEAVQLHEWLRTLLNKLCYKNQEWFAHQTLFNSVAQIRDIAVNRSRIDSAQVEKLMADAFELTTLLEEERTSKIINGLREDMVSTSKSLGAETEQIRKTFDYKLNEIRVARTKLDRLENATKVALEKSLLGRQENARSKIMQSIQKAEAVDQMLDPVSRSGAMSSLDMVNDLEHSLMLDDEGRDYVSPSRSSWFA